MKTPESGDSFIVKVWVEEEVQAEQSAIWRGHITHVPSGTRRYIENLNDIPLFVRPYLERVGVKFRRFDWLRQAWKRFWLL